MCKQMEYNSRMAKTLSDHAEARKAFHDYISLFDTSDPRVQMKAKHSLEVARLSEEIAKALSMTQEETDLAYFAGLLHDIGHFEQLKRYGTFFDAASIDHAALGADLLFHDGLIRSYLEDDSHDDVLEQTIRAHNRYRLPKNQDDTVRTFCRILRDADKIDILRIGAKEPPDLVYEAPLEEVLSSKISPEVTRVFLARHVVDHALKLTPADFMAGDASLAFGLFFRESRAILKEHGYHLTIFSHPVTDEETSEAFRQMEAELIAYLR